MLDNGTKSRTGLAAPLAWILLLAIETPQAGAFMAGGSENLGEGSTPPEISDDWITGVTETNMPGVFRATLSNGRTVPIRPEEATRLLRRLLPERAAPGSAPPGPGAGGAATRPEIAMTTDTAVRSTLLSTASVSPPTLGALGAAVAAHEAANAAAMRASSVGEGASTAPNPGPRRIELRDCSSTGTGGHLALPSFLEITPPAEPSRPSVAPTNPDATSPPPPTPTTEVPAIPTGSVAAAAPILGAPAASSLVTAGSVVNQVETEGARVDFLNSVLQAKQAVEDAAQRDTERLTNAYSRLPLRELGERFRRAEREIDTTAELLHQTPAGEPGRDGQLSAGDLARFSRLYLDARDRATIGRSLAEGEAVREQVTGSNPGTGSFLGALLNQPGSASSIGGIVSAETPEARRARIAELFGFTPPPPTDGTSAAAALAKNRSKTSATSADSLSNRIVLFNGLPNADRAAMLANLNLAEPARLGANAGNTVPILHNGYILGGGKTGLDCSSFVSSALPEDVRKSRLTTLDMYAIWLYRWSGIFPKPPSYIPAQQKHIAAVGQAFTAIDISHPQPEIFPGDLLIFRLPWEATGHVFIVRAYNQRLLTATVIEAAQSAGTVREREFPLSFDPTTKKNRRPRPGLFVLRLKPKRNEVCRVTQTAAANLGPPPSAVIRSEGGAR